MELCLIVPIAHIEWMKLLPGRFCLANVEHDEYRQAFGDAVRKGYEVVLDNGAFEGELVDIELYTKLIHELGPRVIVVPDLLNGNAQKNLQHALDFTVDYDYTIKDYFSKDIELMFVPQCERNDVMGYKSTILTAIRSERFQWIGICRNSCYNAFVQYTHTDDESMNKFFFGAWAQQNGILKAARERKTRFHLLGIGGNVSMLQYLWWADRADTASLFFQATLGETVNKGGILSEAVSRPPDYFRRDFGPSSMWEAKLRFNCNAALMCATAAVRLKNKILKDRI